MRLGQPVLVFPGGGNEILKSSTDAKYKLKWRDRSGFARMAMAHGYTIVPVAAVGLEDQLDVVADIPVGQFMSALGFCAPSSSRAELVVPVMKPHRSNLGQRLYFRFLEPIDCSAMGPADAEDPTAVRKVRDECKGRLETGIQALLEERDADPERYLLPAALHGAAKNSSAQS